MLATHPPPQDRRAWRVAVAGGGLASLAFGLALTRGAGAAAAVSLVDPRGAAPGLGGRAYALSASSVAFLSDLGVWSAIARAAQPITAMRVTDSRLVDAVRPDYLTFAADDDDPLAHMVEAAVLDRVLREGCLAANVSFATGRIETFEAGAAAMMIGGPAETPRSAALLVVADGARSLLRERAGIGWIAQSYAQSALVATVGHERDHGGVAIQHFLPAGPFAILPLAGPGRSLPYRSSIVWTEEADRARALLAAPADRQEAALAERFGPGRGALALDTPLASFRLGAGLARRFVADRVALLGDAAHEIHPLAGQGLNLALADAAALAARTVEAVSLGLDPGAAAVLAAYERDRRFDAVALAGLTDGLNRLFSNDRLPVRALRDIGLGLVGRSAVAKRLLGAAAAGSGRRALPAGRASRSGGRA